MRGRPLPEGGLHRYGLRYPIQYNPGELSLFVDQERKRTKELNDNN